MFSAGGSQVFQHTPFCEGRDPEARFQDKLICSKVLDLVFSIFDALMSLTLSYAYVLRLQCMLPLWEKVLRLFYVIPTVYPFTNLPRILTKSILISNEALRNKFLTIETSKKIFFIASISLAVNNTIMHVLLIYQLLAPSSPISRRLNRFRTEKLLLIIIMILNFACVIGSSIYLLQRRFAAVALVYLFSAVDFLIFCRVNRLISKAIRTDGEIRILVPGNHSEGERNSILISRENFDWGETFTNQIMNRGDTNQIINRGNVDAEKCKPDCMHGPNHIVVYNPTSINHPYPPSTLRPDCLYRRYSTDIPTASVEQRYSTYIPTTSVVEQRYSTDIRSASVEQRYSTEIPTASVEQRYSTDIRSASVENHADDIPRVDSFGFLLDSVDQRIDAVDTDPRLYSQTSFGGNSPTTSDSSLGYGDRIMR
ncbi:MAG: hypothetical protein SGCHY_002150 [Lobulomycetales sp.]